MTDILHRRRKRRRISHRGSGFHRMYSVATVPLHRLAGGIYSVSASISDTAGPRERGSQIIGFSIKAPHSSFSGGKWVRPGYLRPTQYSVYFFELPRTLLAG
jgi:hypothetical protein